MAGRETRYRTKPPRLGSVQAADEAASTGTRWRAMKSRQRSMASGLVLVCGPAKPDQSLVPGSSRSNRASWPSLGRSHHPTADGTAVPNPPRGAGRTSPPSTFPGTRRSRYPRGRPPRRHPPRPASRPSSGRGRPRSPRPRCEADTLPGHRGGNSIAVIRPVDRQYRETGAGREPPGMGDGPLAPLMAAASVPEQDQRTVRPGGRRPPQHAWDSARGPAEPELPLDDAAMSRLASDPLKRLDHRATSMGHRFYYSNTSTTH